MPAAAGSTSLATRSQSAIRVPVPGRTDRSCVPSSRIVVIEERQLARDLLKCGLESIGDFEVIAVASVEEWISQRQELPVALVVLCLASGKPLAEAQDQLAALMPAGQEAPVVVMADAIEDVEHVTWILEQGARGYISTDLPLRVASQAMRLVSAGGIYVPATCLYGAGNMAPKTEPAGQIFTARQAAVVDALRRGKANKTIAYELNMCESTVKVHVRNIMKKLKARNRTEVAYLTKDYSKNDQANPSTIRRTLELVHGNR
jgi:DNA-binding NarL/FixJ family response regulator